MEIGKERPSSLCPQLSPCSPGCVPMSPAQGVGGCGLRLDICFWCCNPVMGRGFCQAVPGGSLKVALADRTHQQHLGS